MWIYSEAARLDCPKGDVSNVFAICVSTHYLWNLGAQTLFLQ